MAVSQNIGERLARLRILSPGSQAQQIAGRSEDGQTVRLSDHRGKVVVVDFWADWSPRCRALYEQKRELVSSLKDEPFMVAGRNVLAVEVHQNDARSGDLLLDLSLSSRLPDPQPVIIAKSNQTKIRLCQLASAVAGDAPEMNEPEIDQLLASLSEDNSFDVRIWGVLARSCRSPRPEEIVVPDDFAMNEPELLPALYSLNAVLWEKVRLSRFSESDYQRAVPMARAIARLAENTKAAGTIANTCGVALYRAGHYEHALKLFDKSSSVDGENSVDLAYRAMTFHAMGRIEESQAALVQARTILNRPDEPAAGDAIIAVEQADQILSIQSQPLEK